MLALASLLLIMGAFSGIFYHDGAADQAFWRWRKNPTPQTQAAWEAARGSAIVKETRIRAVMLAAGALAGAAAIRLGRMLGRRPHSSDPPRERA
jgi:hypothetical protein